MTNNTITARLIHEAHRSSFLPKYTGNLFWKFENVVYKTMDSICEDYAGGYWEFYELSNGGFYLAPALNQKLSISVSGNYYHGMISPDAAGVIATLFALFNLVWETQSKDLYEQYLRLIDFAKEHKEAREILAAID